MGLFFAYPDMFRCHQASLDRPLTVGMVVDSPRTPGRAVSDIRVKVHTGQAPALALDDERSIADSATND